MRAVHYLKLSVPLFLISFFVSLLISVVLACHCTAPLKRDMFEIKELPSKLCLTCLADWAYARVPPTGVRSNWLKV